MFCRVTCEIATPRQTIVDRGEATQYFFNGKKVSIFMEASAPVASMEVIPMLIQQVNI
jgi:hypothetical protein